jgi:hypothetical protein
VPLAGGDDAEKWQATRQRSGGFAQSCGWRWSFDKGRSDLCSRHQQRSCGHVFVRLDGIGWKKATWLIFGLAH